MDILYSLVFAASLLILLGLGTWVGVSLIGAGVVALALFSNAPIGQVMATAAWGQSNSWDLAALPMFIWMGELLSRGRLSEYMFRGLVPWLGWLPGRLVHFNVFASALFAAACGSSAATTVTIGKLSMPELLKRGYDERISTGSLAGASTLGFLIPPSIMMIVYGVAAEVSIGRLFIAGILPGLMLTALFSGYVIAWAVMHPDRYPSEGLNWGGLLRSRRALSVAGLGVSALLLGAWTRAHDLALSPAWLPFGSETLVLLVFVLLLLAIVVPKRADEALRMARAFAAGLSYRLHESSRLIPMVILIASVLGSIYAGLASPTDAAAIGVLASLLLSWSWKTLTRRTVIDSLMAATRISCMLAFMLAFMLAGASFLSTAAGFAGIPGELAAWIDTLGLGTFELLAVLTIFYALLGCFLDGISMILLSAAVVLPMIDQAGIDTLWFGIYLVLVVEMSQITPPIGVNLFVLQALTNRDLVFVTKATMPFFFILLIGIVLITLAPEIVLYLPDRMS